MAAGLANTDAPYLRGREAVIFLAAWAGSTFNLGLTALSGVPCGYEHPGRPRSSLEAAFASNPGRLRDRQKCYQLHQRGLKASSEDRTRDLALTKRMLCQTEL